jgi:5-methylcytosine-specific restriction endonuclease McrA
MPKKGKASHTDYERYKSYYLAREASPQGVKKREERAKARREEIKAGKLTGKHDPRTVDHIKSLAKGGSGTALSNLEILSATANRRKFDR